MKKQSLKNSTLALTVCWLSHIGCSVEMALPTEKMTTVARPAVALQTSSTAAKDAMKSLEIKITANDFAFSPEEIRIPVNRPVTFVFENQGQMPHDWVIPELNNLHLAASPGKTATKSLQIDRVGIYTIVCELPGHTDYGMKGRLIVGDAQSTPLKDEVYKPRPLPSGLRALPQPQVAPPPQYSQPTTVPIEIETREVTAMMDNGVAYTYWTFGGTVPGPMIRVKQNDTVALTLKNAIRSQLTHSIDLHAVSGQSGGGKHTQIPPGGSSSFRFKALNPGVYVYHCATPKVAHHVANGMYGLIVVEPLAGLPRVDQEYYVMQGDFYLKGQRRESGWQESSWPKLLTEQPDYVLLNGGVGAVKMAAAQGETVRIFFGVGGPNLTSSFHVIGEIFDRVYPEGASEAMTNVQTTLVPAGGAAIVEMKLDMPGAFPLVDHSLGRLEKGAVGILNVSGDANPTIFQPLTYVTPEPGVAPHESDHQE